MFRGGRHFDTPGALKPHWKPHKRTKAYSYRKKKVQRKETRVPRNNSLKSAGALSLTPMWFPSLCSLKPVRSRTLPATSRHTDTEREGDAEHERHARERKKSNETARHSHKPVYRHKTPSYASAFLRFACRLIEKEKSFWPAFAVTFVFEESRTIKSRGTQTFESLLSISHSRFHAEAILTADKGRNKHLCSFIIRPTLSQMWPEREAGPPFTFKISMLHVFCSSHGLAHFAALFIDPRA